MRLSAIAACVLAAPFVFASIPLRAADPPAPTDDACVLRCNQEEAKCARPAEECERDGDKCRKRCEAGYGPDPLPWSSLPSPLAGQHYACTIAYPAGSPQCPSGCNGPFPDESTATARCVTYGLTHGGSCNRDCRPSAGTSKKSYTCTGRAACKHKDGRTDGCNAISPVTAESAGDAVALNVGSCEDALNLSGGGWSCKRGTLDCRE